MFIEILVALVVLAVVGTTVALFIFPRSLYSEQEKSRFFYLPPRDPGFAGLFSGHALTTWSQAERAMASHCRWAKQARREKKHGFLFNVGTIGGTETLTPIEEKDIRHIMKTNMHNYKKPDAYKALHPIFGEHGMAVVVDEEEHRLLKRTSAPFYTASAVRDYSAYFAKCAGELADSLEKNEGAAIGDELEVLIEDFATDTICHAAFSEDPRGKQFALNYRKLSKLLKQDHAALVGFPLGLRSVLKICSSYYEQLFREAAEHTQSVRRICKSMLMGNENSSSTSAATTSSSSFSSSSEPGQKKCLLDIIRDSQSELSEAQCIDSLAAAVFGASDPPAVSLLWVLYHLAWAPKVQEKLLDELRDCVARDAIPSHEDVQNLPFLHAVLKESMRVEPSVSNFIKVAKKDDVLPSGIKVRKGQEIEISIAVAHADETCWGDDADEFVPERFLDEEKMKQVGECSFLLFSEGNRKCVGYAYAMSLMKITIGTIIRRFEVKPGSDRKPVSKLSLTSRPDLIEKLLFIKRKD